MFGTPDVFGRDQLVVRVEGNSNTNGQSFVPIVVPEWARICHMILWGAGGSGGYGVVGANSTAAGGGGGGSSGQTSLTIPTQLLPPVLYCSVALGNNLGTEVNTSVCAYPDVGAANNVIARATGGSGGSNGSGATGGDGGTAGAIATIAQMPLGGVGNYILLAGQEGIAGGAAVEGAALTPPTTGLRCMGGTGGGGLPAAATVGQAGGLINNSFISIPLIPGAIGPSAGTTPGADGANGFTHDFCGMYHMGGTGGSSTHGSATGAGLVGGNGGKGGTGCGGGGGGGALTGSTQGIGGYGGDGLAILTFI